MEIENGRRIVVYFDRCSHNPSLGEAHLDRGAAKIPWLSGYKIESVYT